MKDNLKEIEYSKYVLDEEYKIIEVDDNFCKLLGYSKEEAKKLYQHDLIFEEDKEEYLKLSLKKLLENKEAYIEHRIKTKDGKGILVFCFGSLSIVDNKEICTIRIIDISKSLILKENNLKIKKQYNNKIKTLEKEKNID